MARAVTLRAVLQGVDVSSPVISGLRRISTTSRSVVGDFRRLTGIIGAVGSAIASTAAWGWVSRYAEGTAEMGRLARQAGLSVERYQELSRAGKAAGIAPETLSTAMRQLNVQLGMAMAGGGRLTSLLRQTDPSGRILRSLRGVKDSGEALRIMADEMAALENPAQRTVMAQAAFGRGGAEMVRIADLGSAGLDRLGAESRKYGVRSQEAVERSIEFRRQLEALRLSTSGTFSGIAVELMPALSQAMASLSEWMAAHKVEIKAWVADTVQGIKDILPGVLELARLVGAALQPVLALIRKILSDISAASKAITSVIGTVADVGGGKAAETARYQEEQRIYQGLQSLPQADVAAAMEAVARRTAAGQAPAPGQAGYLIEVQQAIADARVAARYARGGTGGAEDRQILAIGETARRPLPAQQVTARSKIELTVSDERIRARSVSTDGPADLSISGDVGRGDMFAGQEWE